MQPLNIRQTPNLAGKYKRRDEYNKHKFGVNLGFESLKEMMVAMSDNCEIDIDVPRHLVIKDKGSIQFSKHPKRIIMFVLKKFLKIDQEKMIPVVTFWTENSGTVVNVEVKTDEHAEALLKATNIFDVEVEVSPHKFRNYSRVRIWDTEGLFDAFTDDELQGILAKQAVVTVKREEYMDKRTKERVKGKRYRLTYNKKIPPPYVKFPSLGIRMETELFIPPPMQCFHCQKLGHIEDMCRNKDKGKVCYKCSIVHEGEIGAKCTAESKCLNCSGNHPSSYRGCPAYQQEFNIKKIAVENRVSPREVMIHMKDVGQYVDYSKTSAHKARYAQDEMQKRLDPVEDSIKELRDMFIDFVTTQRRPNRSEDMDISEATKLQEVQISNTNLVNENTRLKEEIESLKVMRQEVETMKTQMTQLRDNKPVDQTPSTELLELKKEVQQLTRDAKKKSDQKIKEDKEINELKAKVKELDKSLKNKDNQIASLKATPKAKQKDKELSELSTEVVFLKDESQLKTKEITSKDAKINELQLQINRLVSVESRDRSVQRSYNRSDHSRSDNRDRERNRITHNTSSPNLFPGATQAPVIESQKID